MQIVRIKEPILRLARLRCSAGLLTVGQKEDGAMSEGREDLVGTRAQIRVQKYPRMAGELQGDGVTRTHREKCMYICCRVMELPGHTGVHV